MFKFLEAVFPGRAHKHRRLTRDENCLVKELMRGILICFRENEELRKLSSSELAGKLMNAALATTMAAVTSTFLDGKKDSFYSACQNAEEAIGGFLEVRGQREESRQKEESE